MSKGEEELAIKQISQTLAGVPRDERSRITMEAIRKREEEEEQGPKKNVN